MAIRTILTQGDPTLHKVCHAVTRFDSKLADLLDDLKETLEDAGGVGLAAPQVGILRRAVIVVPDPEKDEMIELVNPEIVAQQGEQDGLEGCLSIPGMWGYVKRPNWVKIRAQDRYGNWFETEGAELAARCFCHELEHLEGHMYDEHVDRLYTAEEVDAMMAEEEQGAGESKKRRAGRRGARRRR
ncbi:peptide deformylase [Pseudoflavonifractor sp. 60]|uniref:peptide deformylase n=1 Tax=Pseudoflavonifractor sp. 60 TaxID=2304576 RepID=UPI00136DE117|nr:peptide deformylase [Pseudoflavonifractor sp. 60]NBI66904.1 peptide deformylase [Pseudoflavonifractor sp. 60]